MENDTLIQQQTGLLMKISCPVCLFIYLSMMSLAHERQNDLRMKFAPLHIKLCASLCVVGDYFDAVQADTVRSGFALFLGREKHAVFLFEG